VLAVYAALAFELEDNRLRAVLPAFRRGTGRQAMTGGIADELGQVYREAGVRKAAVTRSGTGRPARIGRRLPE
jgi:hypothetical protein